MKTVYACLVSSLADSHAPVVDIHKIGSGGVVELAEQAGGLPSWAPVVGDAGQG